MDVRYISTVCDSENLLSIGESFLKWNRDRIVVRIRIKGANYGGKG